MAPSSWAQWCGAGATLLAVLVALFKDSFREWRRKPKLLATCENSPPWTVRTPLFVTDQATGKPLWTGDSYWLRVKVENKGHTRAEKVQVSASRLYYKPVGVDGEPSEDLKRHFPINLKWSHIHVPILDGISPGMPALCDIIALCDPANPYWSKPAKTPPDTTVGNLQLEVDLPPEFQSLRPGSWKLILRIGAANAKPIEKTLLFSHTGEWKQDDDDMRHECLRISLK
jgi:hypothetical protein